MKIIVALIVCGVACAWASPSCDDSEANKCIRTAGRESDKYPETAEELDELCGLLLEELDCNLEFTERCPKTLTAAFRESLKEYRVAFGRVCDHEDTLRQKYLEKISCLNENVKKVEEECSEAVTVKEYCERAVKMHQCSEDRVEQICGEVGRELFARLYGPKYTATKVFCL